MHVYERIMYNYADYLFRELYKRKLFCTVTMMNKLQEDSFWPASAHRLLLRNVQKMMHLLGMYIYISVFEE